MIRIRKKGQSNFALMILLTLSISIPFHPANAGLTDTQAFTSELDPDQVKIRLLNVIAREDVRVVLLQSGINPTEVEARITALTDQVIAQSCGSTDEAPAGGMAAVALPIGLVILILLGYVLVVTGVIRFGAYAGSKIAEQQREEYAKSTPFPAPPRVGPVPSVDPNKPWTGKWKVTKGQFTSVYAFKQVRNTVVSTNDSDHEVDAKVYGAMVWGKLGMGTRARDFKATIADDYLSFRGNAEGGYSFEALTIQSAPLKPESTTLTVNPSEPWTGKWKVSHGRMPGIWSLTQRGDTVFSTADSDFKLEAKANGVMIRGKWFTKGGADRDFQATIMMTQTAILRSSSN